VSKRYGIIIYVGGVDGEYWWAKIVARHILGKPASGNRSCLLKRHLIIKATRSACHDSASDSLALAPEIDDAQPQVDHECLSTSVDNSRHHASRASRSPSVASGGPSWLPQTHQDRGFKLPSTPEHLRLPIDPNALDINHDAAAHSQIHQVPLKPKKSKVSWVEDDIKLAQMWNEGRSYIFAALPE
jgi:hypothetical protein